MRKTAVIKRMIRGFNDALKLMNSASRGSKNNEGFTIMELIVVLAVGLALVVAGFIYYRTMDNKKKVNEEVSFMGVLSTEIQRLFSYQGNYSGLNSEVLIRAGIIPQNRIGQSNNQQVIKNMFGGTITVGPDNNVNQYTIAYNNVPKQPCIDLAMASAGISNLVQLKINEVTLNPNQITLENVSSSRACGAGDSNNLTIVAR